MLAVQRTRPSGRGTSVTSINTVSLENWLTPPHNREAFWRVRDLAPTRPIRNDSGRINRLAERPVNLDDVRVPSGVGGSSETLSDHLRRTNCDGLCVVRNGVVKYEWHPRGIEGAYQAAIENPASRHLLMSVSKSLCATVLGAAVGRGDISLNDRVCEVAPEFLDTSVAQATVRHLIDMTAGTDFVEDYASYSQPHSDIQVIEYERQANFRPLEGRTPIGVLAHFRTYGLAREHGSWFDYRSPLTNVVARLLECSTGLDYPTLLSRDLWEPIGAEHPAEIVVDSLGFPIAEAGISCSLRDLARVGMAYVDDGSLSGTQVIPCDWVGESSTIDSIAYDSFAAAPTKDVRSDAPWAPRAYRNAWWLIDSERVMTGLGIFGQFCWVHRPSRTVIARFSTWPEASINEHRDACLQAFGVIVEAL
ncbi:MAG: serine hydrolase domain-containing protein [Ilumatobacteraceae bacterium]